MKEYPVRGNIKLDNPEEILFDLCECGDPSYRHPYDSDIDDRLTCDICNCPKYVFERKVTMDVIIGIKEEKMKQRQRGICT